MWKIGGLVVFHQSLIVKTMELPFMNLGLPMGADARKVSTWQLIIDKMKMKLSSWKRQHLSFRGFGEIRTFLTLTLLSILFHCS